MISLSIGQRDLSQVAEAMCWPLPLFFALL